MSNFSFNARIKNTNSHVGKRQSSFIEDEKKMSRHHVPPVNSDYVPRIIKVDERHHRAYHLIFGNPKNYEDACAILKRDWW